MILKDGTDWQPTETELAVYRRAYPNLDVDQELAKMDAWSLSNTSKRKTRRGAPRFVNSWLNRAKPSVSRGTSTRDRTLAEDLNDTSWAL